MPDSSSPVTPDPVHGIEAQRFGGWQWREPSRGEHFRRCSYCGSINPDDLAAEPNWHADWADRKYGWPHKFYVDIPNRDPERLFVLGSANSPANWMISTADLTPEQEQVMERDGYGVGSRYRPEFVHFDTRANHFGKFYTVHLADESLDPAVKDTIERRSGLRFNFADGRVNWQAVASA